MLIDKNSVEGILGISGLFCVRPGFLYTLEALIFFLEQKKLPIFLLL